MFQALDSRGFLERYGFGVDKKDFACQVSAEDALVVVHCGEVIGQDMREAARLLGDFLEKCPDDRSVYIAFFASVNVTRGGVRRGRFAVIQFVCIALGIMHPQQTYEATSEKILGKFSVCKIVTFAPRPWKWAADRVAGWVTMCEIGSFNLGAVSQMTAILTPPPRVIILERRVYALLDYMDRVFRWGIGVCVFCGRDPRDFVLLYKLFCEMQDCPEQSPASVFVHMCQPRPWPSHAAVGTPPVFGFPFGFDMALASFVPPQCLMSETPFILPGPPRLPSMMIFPPPEGVVVLLPSGTVVPLSPAALGAVLQFLQLADSSPNPVAQLE
jgi:hypothetical protein